MGFTSGIIHSDLSAAPIFSLTWLQSTSFPEGLGTIATIDQTIPRERHVVGFICRNTSPDEIRKGGIIIAAEVTIGYSHEDKKI